MGYLWDTFCGSLINRQARINGQGQQNLFSCCAHMIVEHKHIMSLKLLVCSIKFHYITMNYPLFLLSDLFFKFCMIQTNVICKYQCGQNRPKFCAKLAGSGRVRFKEQVKLGWPQNRSKFNSQFEPNLGSGWASRVQILAKLQRVGLLDQTFGSDCNRLVGFIWRH